MNNIIPGKMPSLLQNMPEILKQNQDIWDLFTGKEEYASELFDCYSRFPHCFSARNDCLNPEVSRFLAERGMNIEYPEGKRFAICLTHDVDCTYFSKDCILDIYNRLGANRRNTFLRAPLYLIKQRSNPVWNFGGIMDLEEKYGARSNFFFMATDRDLGRPANYRPEDLSDVFGGITDRGWDIGLHCGYYSYDNADELKKEKSRLEKVLGRRVIGCRNHYLRFDVPNTWEEISTAGFQYDTTFGYADFVGFRNGMCHPFKPFNLSTQKQIDILEIPLTIMDGTLFDYMHLDKETAWKITKKLIDTVEKYNGVLTVLWHNTYMLGDGLKYYEKILGYCRDKGAWMTSCDDMCKWWSGINA